jgi:1,4-dihydroxy-2-naphthoate octaprenyltransferase
VGALAGGIALGLLAGAVLLVNNYRDIEADRRVGRRTLAIVVGRRMTIWIYAALMLLPFVLLPVIGNSLPRGHAWFAFGALPSVALLIYRFIQERPGPGLNRILVRTVQMQLSFGVLFGLGLIW